MIYLYAQGLTLVKLERKATSSDIIRFVENHQPCKFTDIINYLTSNIVNEGIDSITKSTAKNWLGKLMEDKELLKDGGGKYIVANTAPAPRYRAFESMERLVSPFVKSITLYIMNSGSPDSLRRFQEYIAMRIKLQYDVKVLRFHDITPLSEGKIGNNYRYAAFVFQKNSLKEVYLNTDKTTDYSGEGGHWNKKVEDFLSKNKVEIDTLDAGLETQPEELKSLLIRYIVECGIM